jgi:hypothetical protein
MMLECIWCTAPLRIADVVGVLDQPCCSIRCARLLLDAELRRIERARGLLERRYDAA